LVEYGFPDAQFILSADNSNFSYDFMTAEKSKKDASSTEMQASQGEHVNQYSKRDSLSNKTLRGDPGISIAENDQASIKSSHIQKSAPMKNDVNIEKKVQLKGANKRSLDVATKPTPPQKIMKRVDAPKERTECTQEVIRTIETLDEGYDHEATFDKVQNTITSFMNAISTVETGKNLSRSSL
jgi:hypothetical protein